MDNTLMAMLANTLQLTGLEPENEPYILTEEEENSVLEHELTIAKKNKAWKLAQYDMLSEGEILKRIAEIDWENEIDRSAILAKANSSKNNILWQKENRRKEKEQKESAAQALREKCDAKYFFQLMKYNSQETYGKKLIVNEYNKKFITAICFFFSGDKRFETELGYSFKKGLLIRGVSGIGKTHIVKCIQDNEISPISVISMIEVTDAVKSNGEYNVWFPINGCVYLDDVGTEQPIVNHYGTKVAFFKDFMESYYLQDKAYNKLLISTNNSFQEIEDRYGFRVRSRIKDMFNIIDVSGNDMRG